jgi:hypothetical protein
MVVWSHGALARADAKTLDALVSAVRLALPTFSARDLSDTAWAFAALGVTSASKPKLIARMGRAARRQLQTFNAQELLRFLGAFERLGGSDAKLAEAVRKKRSTTYDFPALAEVVGSKPGAEKSEEERLSLRRRFPESPTSPSARWRWRRRRRRASRARKKSGRAWTTAAAGGAAGTRAWRCGRGRLCSRSGSRAKPIRVGRRT